MTAHTTPSVLFVCVKNGGKSQMADDLIRAADRVIVLAATPKCTPSTAHRSRSGKSTNPPNAESTASNACAWSAMTSTTA